jgi:iron(III) transport system ATP-binding protein
MIPIDPARDLPSKAPDYLLQLSDITCNYGRENAVQNVSISVNPGAQVCLLGPSGCGKTTILRAIAGFQSISTGTIHIGGQQVCGPNMNLPPEQRRVGMVFQDHALFPHLTVEENVASGLRRLSVQDRQRNMRELLERMGLRSHAARYPHELSGGQQQRVALARALAPKPLLLLMDEPFSNLDLDLRERMGQEISDELKENNITCVMVTHDQNDAFALGDEVGVMSAGSIIQWDTPYNLYHQPVDRFVADFIGNGVFLQGEVISSQSVQTKLSKLTRTNRLQWPVGTEVEVLIRPDDVVHDLDRAIEAVVVRRAFKGAEILYTLKVEAGIILLALFPSHANFDVGETVGVRLEVDHLVAFPRFGVERPQN